MKRLSKHDKIFIIYTVALSAIIFTTFFLNHIWADEGTHLLLSIFYKDLVTFVVETRTLSFKQLYQYGINYLISYPKLQIAYTPLFHMTTAVGFFLFGTSALVGRTVSLLYAAGAALIFYFLAKKFFEPRTAVIAAVLFSLSPIFLIYSSRAMMDSTVMFWLLASCYAFATALEKNSLKYYALTGFFTFLAALGKQMGTIVLLFYALVVFKNPLKIKNWSMQNLKKSFVVLFIFAMLFLPYLYAMSLIGGIKLNELVAVGYASEQGEPTSLADYNFWLYYLYKPLTISPLMPLLLLALAFYCYNKKDHWQQMLLFFAIFYICITIIPNKELRFSQFFMLPAYVAGAYYVGRMKRFSIAIIAAYLLVSTAVFLPRIVQYPTEKIAEFISKNNKHGGNVAVLSEDEPLYSSSLMWHMRMLDSEKNTRFYRSCIFDQQNRTEIISMLKENNIYFVVYSSWSGDKTIEKIADKLDLKFKLDVGGYETKVYSYKDFAYKDVKKCNFICLTKEAVCTS